MDHLDASELVPPAVLAVDDPPTPLQEQIAAACAELAASFRSLQTVSGQAAALLENGTGTAHDLASLVQVFEQLQLQAGNRLMTLGAMCGSAGSA
ncbi:hypothetical protein MKK84_11370 [Methylobacterium sp. E-065]|uniref:hypothetical protein n=1 Tax=Methylobacterium sp. E-065 TaxID=2836583 RepID=UPI001FBB9ABD|nr:hypothetical protein [Methylobacterium sp. E-065]MCJ2018019.1 hypothetical protein [Methylobacterium sp. E-065]